MTIPFSIIVAVDANFGIGKDGKLPWHIPEDLKYFKEITTGISCKKNNVVIMGRKTWESIPFPNRPLINRTNIVVTSSTAVSLPKDVMRAATFENALKQAKDIVLNNEGEAFVIGGEKIFNQSFNNPFCTNLYITRIVKDFNCDVFFPSNLECFEKIGSIAMQTVDNIPYFHEKYRRKRL